MRSAQGRLLGSNAADAAGRSLADFTIEVLFIGALGASAADMGLLYALGSLAFVAATLPAGLLCDRWGAVRTLRLGLGAKVVLLACLLVLALDGALSIPLGLALATLLGCCNVFGETAQIVAVPVLKDPAHSMGSLVARLAAADQALGIILPAVAGTVFALAGAPPLLAAALLLGLAALGLALALRTAPATAAKIPRDVTSRPTRGVSPIEGFRFLAGNRLLLVLTLAVMFCNLGLAIGSAVEGLLVMRDLGFGAGGFGAYSAVGAVGGLVGAALASRVSTRFKPAQLAAPTLGAQLIFAGLVLAAAVAPRDWSVALLAAHALGWGVLVIIFNVAVSAWVVELTPEPLLGRVIGARRFFTFGVVPLGGLLGGMVGESWGLKAALLLWVAAQAAALLVYLLLGATRRRIAGRDGDESLVPE